MSGTKFSSRQNAGYFGIVIYKPKFETNVGTLWRSAFLQNAAFVGTVGARYKLQASDTPHTTNHIPLVHYTDIDDMINRLPFSCPLIAVELDDCAKSLPEFWHPPRAVYLLGAEDNGIPRSVLDRCHYVVQIPTVRDWSMNVAAAGSIVMYDRMAKARI